MPTDAVVGFVGFAGLEASSADLRSPLGQILTEALLAHGLRAVPITELRQRPSVLLSFNHHDDALREARRWGLPKGRLLLGLFEPPAVRPDQHRTTLWRKYGLVVSPSLAWAASSGGAFLPWPQTLDSALAPTEAGPRDRRAALLNANKWSATGDSLYGLRRQVIQRSHRQGVDLDVYGDGWDRRGAQNLPFVVGALAVAFRAHRVPDPRELVRGINGSANWKGVAADKAATLSRYQLSVVIENSATYLSEKLFDALVAGTVPIYVGPRLADFGIPEEVAVQVPARVDAVVGAIHDLDGKALGTVRRAGAAFLADPATQQRWSSTAVMGGLAELVARCAEVPGHEGDVRE